MDTPEKILRELALHLSFDAGANGTMHTDRPVGSLVLSTAEGSLWSRVLAVLGGEPDMIRDVVGPALCARPAEDDGKPLA